MTTKLAGDLPKYPPNLKLRWRIRFVLDDAWFVLTHLHEYRIVHKVRVGPRQ